MNKILIGLLVLMGGTLPLSAQEKYWVFFTDKNESQALLPWEYLSPRALENRARQGITPDWYDLPVADGYLAELRQRGIDPQRRTRWFNAVSAYLDEAQLSQVAALPFVRDVRPVGHYRSVAAEAEAQVQRTKALNGDDPFRETHVRQLDMIGLTHLHRQGLTGQDVLVAVFDNGYDAVDTLAGFRQLFDQGRIIATRDFVDGDQDLFHRCAHCRHGTYVFSILAAVMPGQLVGSAPGADYLLLRTENDASETTQEEDNWLAAAEFADSLGAQIFTTSLGYLTFDGGEGDYTQADLDGNTALITRAGDRAASRGILVVNSAGNNGNRGLNAPADGDSVIAIGSVNLDAEYSGFSSRGPTADGRIKPDLTAMGQDNFYLHPNGSVRTGSGTSFSCPMVSGLAACLMQAYPQASAWEVFQAMRQTASQADSPDNRLGYGLPDGRAAWQWLSERYAPQGRSPLESDYRPELSFPVTWAFYPNPAQDWLYLDVPIGDQTGGFPDGIDLEWLDLTGRVIAREAARPVTRQMAIATPRSSGLYVLRLRSHSDGEVLHREKILVRRP